MASAIAGPFGHSEYSVSASTIGAFPSPCGIVRTLRLMREMARMALLGAPFASLTFPRASTR
jgi:hypothetical protein